jgi:hypothetical protein
MKRPLTLSGLARRVAILSTACIGTAVVVSACGGLRREQRAEWRAQAEIACLKSGKVRETPYVKISKSIDGPGVCGANYPMKVSAVTAAIPQNVQGTGNLMLTSGNLMLTSVTPTATLSCPMVAGVDAWLATDVQQAAMTWFGQPVIELITFGSFSCRPMNNRSGARLSEHSFANAIDAKGFRLADGRTVTVLKGWRGQPDEQGFLREVAIGACRHFTTVLAPGSDAYHYDHIHVDMARHNRGMHVCRPKLQMPVPPMAQQPLLAGGYQGGPVYKSEPPLAQQRLSSTPVLKPSTGQLYHGPDDGPDEVEDIRDERNFDGKQFDLTGSIPAPGDPKIVTQRPGPARR